MKKVFKKYFIPHHENNFHPHILHTKRAVFYGLVFLLTKGIIVAFVLLLPIGAFVLPDVLAEEQRQIVALTNKVRQEKNLPALVVSEKLGVSAQNKADDMAQKSYFAHVNDQKSLSTWLKGAGYSYEVAGENLAVGFSTAEQIITAWKNSPTHYDNLVDSDFKDLGIGLAGGEYKGRAVIFIAQHLASPIAAAKIEKPAVKKEAVKKSPVTETKAVAFSQKNNPASSSVLSGRIKNSDERELAVINTDQPTPVEKYIQAKQVLSPLTNIFSVSQTIYFWAMIFFGSALLLSVLINMRRQRGHIVAQTAGLLTLLFVFWKF